LFVIFVFAETVVITIGHKTYSSKIEKVCVRFLRRNRKVTIYLRHLRFRLFDRTLHIDDTHAATEDHSHDIEYEEKGSEVSLYLPHTKVVPIDEIWFYGISYLEPLTFE
jgi:hypothetical protein